MIKELKDWISHDYFFQGILIGFPFGAIFACAIIWGLKP